MALALLPFILLAAQSPLTLGEALALPPAEAGDRILESTAHGPIVELEVLAQRGMDPSGSFEVELREAVRVLPDGCHRPSWRVMFSHNPYQSREAAQPSSSYAEQEVALKMAGNCAAVEFATTGGKLTVGDALYALNIFQKALSEARSGRVPCRDSTRSGLCRNDKHLRQELGKLSPWVVTDQDGDTEIWLGTPGQTITVVTLAKNPERITKVSRYVPAPF